MIFIFLHIAVLAAIVQSTLRTDCYISFSNPAIYVKISHYYPIGPIYLFASIFAYHDWNIHDRESENDQIYLHFKRFDNKCTPSILFTTLGSDFKKLGILISLSLSQFGYYFAYFRYNFYKDFKPGFYGLFDEYQNFLLHAQIRDAEKNYLKIIESSEVMAYSYVNSINGNNSEICVITYNNQALILKPNYIDIASYGIIIHLRGDLYINKKLYDFVNYPAFECDTNEEYSGDSLILITNGDYIQVSFSVIDVRNKQKKFELSNPKIYDVKNLKHIPNRHKQLFLITYHPDLITCPDRSKRILYISKKNKITYYVHVVEIIYISSLVNFNARISGSPFNICGLRDVKK